MFDPILIIGAGLSGLIAARELRASGYKAIVFEESAVPGGRMATRHLRQAYFDSGAQFFTVREARFAALVEEWLHAGVAGIWSHGFQGASGRPRRDGHPRYRGVPGMEGLTNYLARDLDLRLNRRVESANVVDGSWRLALAGGEQIDGRALIMTPPVPLSLAILEAGGTALPHAAHEQLGVIEYAPCLALLIELPQKSSIPPPGGLQLHGEPITFIGDNHQKGVSPTATAITIHAGPLFSEAHWQALDDEIAPLLLDEASYWLGPQPVRAQNLASLNWRLDRWPYSIPKETIERRFLAIPGPPPLLFAGDAFGGPRVEGAALSGLAAAQQLITEIPQLKSGD